MSGAPVPPRFSIVIPCFNQGTFLAECLASLRAQTLPPYEVLVVDDGSTDPYSVRRMDELCVDGVKLLRQENRGLPGARNTGVRAATGDWVLPLDADDCLAPEALATYARAIAAAPEVDVWYPDMEHFGQDTSVWECPPFNAWRLLTENHLLCSSAIRRAVFDAGVLYNEAMRQGYEDWEFYIHACVEKGFLARPLERPVFRYRKWGYSMVSASDAKRAALLEQIRRERSAVYGDSQRLVELKARHQPYLAVASASEALRPALEGQRLRDFQLVDTSGRVTREEGLGAFQGHRFSRLLVSLEDASLAAALHADPFLLEKVARVSLEQRPSVLWLVTTGPEQAWPGFLLSEAAARAGDVRCVGFAVDPSRLLGAPPIPRTGAGLLEDLARHLEGLVPGSQAWMGVGPSLKAGEGAALPQVALSVPAPGVGPASGRGVEVRQGLKLVGQGANTLLRGLLGAERHARLRASPVTRQLGSRLRARLRAPAEPVRVEDVEHREGPFAAWQLDSRRQREELARTFGQPPRYDERPEDGEPALLIVTSSVSRGDVAQSRADGTSSVSRGAVAQSRADGTSSVSRGDVAQPRVDGTSSASRGDVEPSLVELLKGLHALAPTQRRYLVTTEYPDAPAWADTVLPLVRGAFAAPDLASRTMPDFIASLAKRLGVGAVLMTHTRAGLEALPALRQLEPRPRVIALAGPLPPRDSVTGLYSGPSAEAAARFNNLIDGYAVSSQDTADRFVRDLYVSPTKLRLMPLAEADRARYARELMELLFPEAQRRTAP
ncbi:glycosyltransferase family A protein [Pyxidicoccus trucidator]|uniref:glycosyltransferase family A protein n=1 Tax=Pyxidicoccus trucidator TaxID=2709662 RepID=UPI0013DA7B08|nr:glycosyltransferase family A protein [Pyxidicoccus trucidator]